jgi:hypothetical protein
VGANPQVRPYGSPPKDPREDGIHVARAAVKTTSSLTKGEVLKKDFFQIHFLSSCVLSPMWKRSPLLVCSEAAITAIYLLFQ